jgi:hypothetical protein
MTAREDLVDSFVKKDLDRHQMTENMPSKAWRFQRVGDDGRCSPATGSRWIPYGFVLSWHPGQFAAMGDIGEIQIVHTQAIGYDLRSSLEWLASGEVTYLLGKSSIERVYDADQTARHMAEMAMDMDRPDLANAMQESGVSWVDDSDEREDVLRGMFQEHCDDGPQGAMDFWTVIAGNGDPEMISYEWPHSALMLVGAMRFAAQHLLAAMDAVDNDKKRKERG